MLKLLQRTYFIKHYLEVRNYCTNNLQLLNYIHVLNLKIKSTVKWEKNVPGNTKNSFLIHYEIVLNQNLEINVVKQIK